MIPIRVEAPIVEPVSVAELQAYLRLDPDDTSEDALLGALVAAARASLEIECRRLLVPGRYRIALLAWPRGGLLPVPLSPLVSVEVAGLVDGAGTLVPIDPGLVTLGPDPIETPCLRIAPDAPAPMGRSILIEVGAGFGGDGPVLPAPLRLAMLRLAAARYEHRGDEAEPALPDASQLAAPFRRLRL